MNHKTSRYLVPTLVVFAFNAIFFGSLAWTTRYSTPDILPLASAFFFMQLIGAATHLAYGNLQDRLAEQRDASLSSHIDAAEETLKEFEARLIAARKINANLSSRLHATTLTNLSLTTKNKELQDELAIYRAQSGK